MSEHLLQAGGPRGTAVEANQMSRLPYLRTWFRTRKAIVLHLSNGILQVSIARAFSRMLIWGGVLCPTVFFQE